MAVGLPEPPKSTPEMAKLTGMTSRTLMVTQYTSRSTAGRLVVGPEQNVEVNRIFDLMRGQLVAKYGPGTYKFEVGDEGGPDREQWTVKLGPDGPDSNAGPFAGGPADPFAGANGDSFSSLQIAPGWFYNEQIGAIVSPRGQIMKWAPGAPLPAGIGPTAAPGQTIFPAPATPVSAPSFGGWGNEPDPRLKALEDQLRAEREARKEEENRRALDDLRTGFAKTVEAMNLRFETLLEKIAAPKAGPTDEVAALRAELDRQRERQEARDREELLRAEMRAAEARTQELLREMKGAAAENPMMTLLGQLMMASQGSGAAAVAAIRDSSQMQNESMRAQLQLLADKMGSSTMTPERMIEFMRSISTTSKTANEAINSEQVGMFKTLFGMARDVIDMQRDAGGPAPSPWMGLAEKLVEGAGKIGQIAAAAAATKPAMVAQPRPQQPRQPAVAGQPGRPAVGPVARPAPVHVMTSTEEREAVAERVFKRKKPSSDRMGAAAAATPGTPAGEAPKRAPRRRPVPIGVGPDVAPVSAEAPIEVVEAADQQVGQPPTVLSVQQLAQLPIEMIRQIAGGFADDEFFGSLVQRVGELRQGVTANLAPALAAEYALQGRDHLRGASEFPPVLELLLAGHLTVVVERLFPNATDEYRALVVEAMDAQMRADMPEDEEDEGDDAAA
jgi:hypothetical protein